MTVHHQHVSTVNQQFRFYAFSLITIYNFCLTHPTVLHKYTHHLPEYKMPTISQSISWSTMGSHITTTHKVQNIQHKYFPTNWRLWRVVILCSGIYRITTGHHLTNKSWIPFLTWSAAICNLYMRYWILVLSTCQFIISYRRNCEMNPGFGPTNLRLDFTLEQD